MADWVEGREVWVSELPERVALYWRFWYCRMLLGGPQREDMTPLHSGEQLCKIRIQRFWFGLLCTIDEFIPKT